MKRTGRMAGLEDDGSHKAARRPSRSSSRSDQRSTSSSERYTATPPERSSDEEAGGQGGQDGQLEEEEEDEDEDDEDLSVPAETLPGTWQTTFKKLCGDGASRKQQLEYRKTFGHVKKIADALEENSPAPLPYVGTPANYIVTLNRDLRLLLHEWCLEDFDKQIKGVADKKELLQILLDQHRMVKEYNSGAWPWPSKDVDIRKRDRDEDLKALARRLSIDAEPGDPDTLEGEWEFNQVLGSGGFGYASLWVKTGANGSIVHRMVIKETPFTEREWKKRGRYSDWFDESRAAPYEAAFQSSLNGLQESFNVVELISYRMVDSHRMVRLYLEYCPLGDLQDMISKHLEAESWVSPHFLWAAFEGLVSAACLMRYGRLPPHSPNNDWKPMLHSDIKSANVFLSLPHPPTGGDGTIGSWPKLPVPKLGDFGGSHYQRQASIFAGTPGFSAPERDDPSKETFASDLFSIARVILCLMERDAEGHEVSWDDETSEPLIDEATRKYYHSRCPELLELIVQCLKLEPEDRPTCEKVWEDIRKHVAVPPGLIQPPMKLTPVPDEYQVLHGGEQYPDGYP